MPMINIKLAEGKSLFLPSTRTLMEKGKVYAVQANQFWNRRIHDGDVLVVEQKSKKKKSTDKEK